MNYKLIFQYLGKVLSLLAALMLLPLLVSLLNRDLEDVRGFLFTIILLLAVGIPLGRLKCTNTRLFAKEGFLIVAVSWLALSVFGALPFYLTGAIPHYLDSLFEAVSGFTTTGASILREVESLSPGILFWRSFTHWIGGMGVLIFLMAIIPAVAGDRALHLLKAESPGHDPGKLVPKMRQSSMLLYVIYLVLTLVQVVFLLAGGMPLFDSIVTAMGTAGTGGFSVMNASIAGYNSLYCEVVITVFMFIFGINFNIFYLILIRNLSGAFKNEELRAYFGIVVVSIALITVNLTGTAYPTIGQSLRYASFHVSSYITTTGFTNITHMDWPLLSRMIVLVLMFVGGCSGSTAGGLKVSRIVIMFKEIKRNLFQIIHPRSVEIVKLDGKAVDKGVVHGVCVYGCICMFIFCASLFVVSLDNMDVETTIAAVATCLNNVGLGLGKVGPGGNFADFSLLSKGVLTFAMLLGRLELYPLLLLISPRTWRKV